jgi:geranylgeranyl pyrophosphate synthase
MQVAADMFQPQELMKLAPRQHGGTPAAHSSVAHSSLTHSTSHLNGQSLPDLDSLVATDPLAATEAIAYDFLAKGGKHSRPFITLAAYQALKTSGADAQKSAGQNLPGLSDAVKRCALSIETFHKASLVHDDIEDDDEFRYGLPTLHRQYGTPTAINVGDYLIGLGYRLVSRESAALGAEVVGDILDRLADAHMKLSEGQGAELMWRDSRDKRLTSADALKIYSLKTAPAFEAALYTGLRLARPAGDLLELMRQFARNLGVAFQIINDLNDWHGDNHNKLSAAGDVIGGRPTVLWALALERLPAEARRRLETLAATQPLNAAQLQEIRLLYQQAGVFQEAEQLVEKHQQRAKNIADEIVPEPLQQLFYYLIDLVLERRQLQPLATATG